MSLRFSEIYSTPVPAAFTAGLLFTQIRRPGAIKAGAFGSAFLLGSWMMYDGDYKNGAGFTAVWSTLYLMANRRAFGRKLVPTIAVGLAAANAVGYAIGFARPSSSSPGGGLGVPEFIEPPSVPERASSAPIPMQSSRPGSS